ncbi:MAG: roadblock/LC7 domain-containing protein [Pseudomonadota bacterium]
MTQSAGTEALTHILANLHGDVKDIEGSLVISRDGLTMAAHGLSFDIDSAGAVCTELYGQGGALANELQRGQVHEVLLRTEHGYVLVVPAGEELYLALLARADANLGLLFLEIHRTAEAVAATLTRKG